MNAGIGVRDAEVEDAVAMAPLILMAGGGVYEFLLDGLVPGVSVELMMASGLSQRAGSFSYRQCLVAMEGEVMVGMAHAHPVDWMRDSDRRALPADRIALFAAFDETQDWGSYFLSAITVLEGWRRSGLGRRLIAAVEARARQAGFDRLSLQVWADNTGALEFYRALGFTQKARVEIAWDPRLGHRGGSVLLGRPV